MLISLNDMSLVRAKYVWHYTQTVGTKISLCNCVVCQSKCSSPFDFQKAYLLRLTCSDCASAQTSLDIGVLHTPQGWLYHDTTQMACARKKCASTHNIFSEICMYTQPGGTKICLRSCVVYRALIAHASSQDTRVLLMEIRLVLSWHEVCARENVFHPILGKANAVPLVSFLFALFTTPQCMMLKTAYTCCERIHVTTDWTDSSRRMWQFSEGAALGLHHWQSG